MTIKFIIYVVIATIFIVIQDLLVYSSRLFFGYLTLDTIIFSSIVGLVFGIYLALKHKLPKSNMGMNCILLLLFISPYIMVSGYLIASETPFGEMHGINLSLVMFSTLLSQIITTVIINIFKLNKIQTV